MRAEYRPYVNEFRQPLTTRGGSICVVTYSWIGGAGVQQDDGTYTPSEFSYAEDFGGDGPQYLVECSHDEDLLPRVDAVHVVRREGGREVRSADLNRLRNLEDVIHDAWLAASRRPSVVVADGDSERPTLSRAIERDEMKRTVRTLRKQARRKLTPDLLRQVADTYRENLPTGSPVQAVADRFGVASSTAFRYVNKARTAGYLEPKETNE